MLAASTTRRLEWASYFVVALSAAAALAFQAWLGSRAWPALPIVAAVCAGTGAALALRAPRVAWSTAAILVCVLPALMAPSLRPLRHLAFTPFLAGLLGVVIGTTRLHGWALPVTWRAPLALWSLSVALVWPVIVARETSFMWPLLFDPRVSVSALGVSPAEQIIWMLRVVVTHLLGVLWLDALFRTFRDRPKGSFERWVLLPLLAGTVASAAVGVVQSLYDTTLLNPSNYGGLGRAAGLMLDGNVFGVVTALCGAAAVVVGLREGGQRQAAVAAGIWALCAVAVWGSGSRTSLAVLLFTAVPIAVVLPRALSRKALMVTIVALLAGILAVSQSSAVVGPVKRLAKVAGPKVSVGTTAQRLWSRDRYGTYAHRMILDEPVIGIGLGMFHSMVSDYSMMDRGRTITADNAQNWFRHNLAEMGLLGCAGWLWWLAVFARGATRAGPSDERWPRRILLWSLSGLAFASLFGMATQHIAALLVMWTLVYWHTALAPPAPETSGVRSLSAMFVWLLALAFVGLTAWAAVGHLQVTQRALRAEWRYQQGFIPMEDASAPRGSRWLAGRASAVVQMRGPYVVLRVWTPNPVAASVRVSRNGRTIATLTPGTSTDPVLYIKAPDDTRVMLLEFDVTTPVPASPIESSGVAIGPWRMVRTPPRGALVVE